MARPDTRLTQMIAATGNKVRALLVPRAKVLVAVPDDFFRSLLANTIATAGHEVVEHRTPQDAASVARSTRPDIVVLDLPDAALAGAELRKSDEFRNVALIVCAEEGRQADVHKALLGGANDSVPKPPRREAILEKVRGCMASLGRSVRLKPAVQVDRRRAAREGGHFVCGLQDTFLSKPLPVPSATVLDIGEGGLRIEYALPSWSVLHAYTSHGVHPRHFFYNYAKSNPLGRELTVTLPASGGTPLEAFAKFVHVELSGGSEVAGVAFQKVSGSLETHLSTVRRRL
jgi:CheY-like chemotaxis protein